MAARAHLGLELLNLVLELADVLRRVRVVQLALDAALLSLRGGAGTRRSARAALVPAPPLPRAGPATATHLDLQLCDALPHLGHRGHAVRLPQAYSHHLLLALEWGQREGQGG